MWSPHIQRECKDINIISGSIKMGEGADGEPVLLLGPSPYGRVLSQGQLLVTVGYDYLNRCGHDVQSLGSTRSGQCKEITPRVSNPYSRYYRESADDFGHGLCDVVVSKATAGFGRWRSISSKCLRPASRTSLYIGLIGTGHEDARDVGDDSSESSQIRQLPNVSVNCGEYMRCHASRTLRAARSPGCLVYFRVLRAEHVCATAYSPRRRLPW